MTTEVGTLVFKTETSGIVKAEKELARAEKEAAKLEKAQQRAAAQAVKLSNAKYKAAAAAGKAAKSYNAVVAELIKADIEAKKAAQSIKKVEVASETTVRTMGELEAVAMKGRGGFRAMRGSTAQLGMQIQDMAVQASMGTNSLIILGQQGPQIASLFGPGGAILGAFIAVGAAVANMAFGLGRGKEETDKLADAMSGLEKAFQRTEAGAYGLSSSLLELAERSKQLAEIELAIGIANAKIAFKEAQSAIVTATAAITTAVNTSAQAFEEYNNASPYLRDADAALRRTGERVDELKRRFGLSTEQATEFGAALARFRANKSEENMAALRDVVGGLASTLSENANPQLRDLVTALNDAFIKGQDAQDALKAYNDGLKLTGESAETASTKVEDSIAALELRAATVGMSARAEALYRAELNNATQAEKDRINAAFDTIDAHQEQMKAARDRAAADAAYERERANAIANNQRAVEGYAQAHEDSLIKDRDARNAARQAAVNYLETVLRMNDTEKEAFDRMITERRQKIEADRKSNLLSEAEYQAAKTALDKAEALKRADNEKQIAAERTKALLQMEDVFMSGKSDRAKAAYRLGVNLMNKEKRDNAERIISESYVAAMKAYSALAKIDIVGPVLGAAAAAAVIATGATYAAGALSGRALGGQVRPGESYVVGERGPEILTMGNAGGRVTPNSAITNNSRLTYAPTVNISGGATDQDRAMFMAELRRQKAEIADLMMRRRF